ncbi:shikimate dehydrogenase [Candidatus Vondammii sp. HM_W22]|uniref:shikimate dehydrogenase n=1 Tax=Candidatus Vondammii sp. HM_W22 TaxID=2687299 RepID=UPI001F13E39F|nr:shikimate dehydrogenase [Candidatus Vondammii sp. HM_W22]
MTDRYAVIGNPIEHSKSPLIHAAFAKQTGETLEYSRLLGNPGEFATDVREFFSRGGRGLNVTVPFKEEAWQLADELSHRAKVATAANTLILLSDGRIRGDNTDGVGLIRDLMTNHGFPLRSSHILLLGAGGASRGVIRPLLDENPASLVVANRTASKAVALACELGENGETEGCGLDDLADRQFDLIINATAAGLDGKVPAIPDTLLTTRGWTYDMMYGNEPTAFVRWGLERGAAKSLDGRGMLVEQAAESFFLWRGMMPDTAPMIQALVSYPSISV